MIIIITLTGCKRDINDATDSYNEIQPDNVRILEIITLIDLSDEIDFIYNVSIIDDILYLPAAIINDNDPPFNTTKLFTYNINSKNFTELYNYSNNVTIPDDADGGFLSLLYAMKAGDGNIWVAEYGHFYKYEIPENLNKEDIDDNDIWLYRNMIHNDFLFRKLDNTGNELLSVDHNNLSNSFDHDFFYSFNVDLDDNIYLSFSDIVYVFDTAGNMLFNVEVSINHQVIRLSDGSVAVFNIRDRTGKRLRIIDTRTRSLGNYISLPEETEIIYPGSGDFIAFISDGTSIIGIDHETGKPVQLIDLAANNFISNGILNVASLPDNKFLLISWVGDEDGNNFKLEMIILSLVPQPH